MLTNSLVLNITDPSKEFVVCMDVCIEGLGGVLMRDGFIICYESQKLKDHARNYATHNLELAAILHALKMWQHYLLGRNFELRIDHMILVGPRKRQKSFVQKDEEFGRKVSKAATKKKKSNSKPGVQPIFTRIS